MHWLQGADEPEVVRHRRLQRRPQPDERKDPHSKEVHPHQSVEEEPMGKDPEAPTGQAQNGAAVAASKILQQSRFRKAPNRPRALGSG